MILALCRYKQTKQSQAMIENRPTNSVDEPSTDAVQNEATIRLIPALPGMRW
jgi:HSP20 family molecular chaperone IbpA